MFQDRFKQWQEMAKKLSGGNDFWSSIFGEQNSGQQPFMSDMFRDDAVFPRADVCVDRNHVVVLIELPGVRKEDVQLSVEGDRLRIRGSAPQPYPSANRTINERFSGPFERYIHLPELVAQEGAMARFENGLLTITLARTSPPSGNVIDIL